jgi:AraC-like DNA-binding protein
LCSTFLAFCFAKIAGNKTRHFAAVPRLGEKMPREEEQQRFTHDHLHWEVIRILVTHELTRTTPGHRAEPVEIWKTRKFIEEHSGEELSLRRVAKAVNTHPNYLSERFKQITGTNFVEYVARTRFQRACELLHNGDVRISEVAFASGFQSLSQFNRVFKRLSGKSPTQYRAGKRVVDWHR